MHEIDLGKAQREQTRWRILKILDAGRPLPVSETVVLQILQDAALPVTPSALRREFGYLRERRLILISGTDSPVWAAELTRNGVDLVEYSVDCQPGIARPTKWY